MVPKQLEIHKQKKKKKNLDLDLLPFTNNNLKYTLKCKTQTKKLLGEKPDPWVS